MDQNLLRVCILYRIGIPESSASIDTAHDIPVPPDLVCHPDMIPELEVIIHME